MNSKQQPIKKKFNNLIEKSLLTLKDSATVKEACVKLAVSERSLRRTFKKASLQSPAHYLNTKLLEESLTDEQKKLIIALYSDYAGKPKPISDISKKLNLPKEIIRNFIKENDLTHDGLPVTIKQKQNLTPEKLFSIVDELRDLNLSNNLEYKEKASLKEDAQKWRKFKNSILNSILPIFEKKVQNYNKQHEEKNEESLKNSQNDEYALVIPLQDFHWGKLSKKIDVGPEHEHNFSILKKSLSDSVVFLQDKIEKNGKPEITYLTIGGDFLHVDSSKNETTKGTKQDSESTFSFMLVSGVFEMVNYIDKLILLSKKIKLIPTKGNHDSDSTISLYTMISFWYKDHPNVETYFGDLKNISEFEKLPIKIATRSYEKYGNTLLCFTHGHGARKNDMPLIIAQEARELWSQTKYVYFFQGHFHHKHIKDNQGVMQIQVPSIAGADSWHETNGYTTSNKALAFYCIDKQKGLFCEWNFNK